jgi:predicted nucleic acid-binding protein
MRTTITLDDELVRTAQEYTGVAEKTALVREALKSLIQREGSRRLAALGGTMPELEDIPPASVSELGVAAAMILADTTIWIDHFRSENKEMRRQARCEEHCDPSVHCCGTGPGSLRDRSERSHGWTFCRGCASRKSSEVREMIEMRSLYSRGIGLTDAHLIASCLIDPPTLLWTNDKQLSSVAESLGIAAVFPE